ncbi:hypothetical protein AI2719V1_2940 [Enterobacter cloacae]|nr:DUF2345 domain-containing protein [Enterobacter roggenkampii]CAE6233689.1 hypothetical protein AI2705V1_1246 [Enterobacter cloacae]CAF3147568.1 hypothetical protein AI2984V2_3063 [Enterobacter cloacae]CAH3403430.1 hypothetical protein AI2705V1_1246 [Enterobacter cloacae]CAH3678338.1 hypothetical protein AI2719V1_2940 [Enterobacter cloacae]
MHRRCPATFEAGGRDATSQCLLGLVGLGIPGTAEQVATPVSRFLALLGTMRLPTRNAEGIRALVSLLAPNTRAIITEPDPVKVHIDKPLNEALLMSAPEGMALTSGEHLQMTAAKNVAINAGGDISIGTMGNMTVLAGEKLGLFARTGQLSLKSGEGPIDVQAQNASLRLFAEQKLTLSSASDISFAGKKRITLTGGGSYLRLEAGKVEYGTTAMYMRKVKRTMAAGSSTLGQGTAEMPAPLPNLSCGPNTACFRVLDSLTGSEDMEFAYQLQTSTGTVVGRTDSALTHAINSDTEENVNLDYVFQIRAGTR